MIKYGARLGALGKFIKRFVFNVKKGEEDQLNMQYSFLLRRQRNASWDVADVRTEATDFEELGFHNNAYTLSQDLGERTRNGTIHRGLHENGDAIMNGISDITNFEHLNGRTKSFKQNGMVTKL